MRSYLNRLQKDLRTNKSIYIMLLPVLAYYLIFQYGPMYGLQIAFKEFYPAKGFLGSPWIGLKNFEDFFGSVYFGRILVNTLLLSLYSLIFFFPAGIIFALLLNEIKGRVFRRAIQSISYMPHFISMVVIVGMLFDFLARDGLINQITALFGIEPISFMQSSGWFRTTYISSEIWQNIGWSSIVYLAAINSINPSLYEAARMDGASRWRQTWHVTLPGIMPTVTIMFILFIGKFMTVGFEKIILMYNPVIYETADVIQTFVYRKGILEANYSYSAAVGLFNAAISFTLLILANMTAKRLGETKLW